MRILDAGVYLPDGQLGPDLTRRLERYARVCYKSEDRMQGGHSSSFIKRILKGGHESVLEHEKITMMLVTDRGVTHEVVRHRIGSYSQESTRYCNYHKDQFDQEISVIRPCFFSKEDPPYSVWEKACQQAEAAYFSLLGGGASPQEARSVLPNSLKTELVVTYNIRQWRHFLALRASRAAHPQARQLAIPILLYLQRMLPDLFLDVPYDADFSAEQMAEIYLTDDMFVVQADR